MKVLVLGATGFIGQRLVSHLRDVGWATPLLAGRRPPATLTGGLEFRQVDTLDVGSLRRALADVDAVVNCVAGEGDAIGLGAKLLVEAAMHTSHPRIVHMSSMAVYGRQEGYLAEDSPLDPGGSWYSQAKCEAERHMTAYAAAGQRLVMLRPGCVHGPGSDMWVAQIARLLAAGRLGDLGPLGAGWSNLVHVDDVCAAVLLALHHEPETGGQTGAIAPAIFNLAGQDSPRWNRYFVDLAQAIGAGPAQTISSARLQLDARLGTLMIRVLQRISGKSGWFGKELPVAMSPSFLRLWQQDLRLDGQRAHSVLKFVARPYEQGLAESAQWALTQGIGTAAAVR
ncbi:NAD-dependent epimerase/dehydratase family protein [Herbaspirillum sp. C7C8]|uniref:NAD-dependent epimerase/dehydratase family protein n=1 Tax=Herbaspirillum sp. C7C8 TaxID=2736665 RepID=UPI001F522B12|nr:NAD-dependent epimerase/dehydratase family protein [Herbaspirillum sp. C7C8]MCI1004763.1 NAD-dependent epimerase/dehydratase family protein [Herbaspirillum sp. C7C8]